LSEIVARARRLVGCRYRAQGRDPQLGLDCVGVVCCAFGIPPGEVLQNYRLRSADVRAAVKSLERHFISIEDGSAGDLLLMSPASDQLHLAVLTDRGFIHADAGVRKVVETPGAPAWPVVGRYRHRTFDRTE
jgi:murein DD-endopeptidase / murein LD-carboxypeptidase